MNDNAPDMLNVTERRIAPRHKVSLESPVLMTGIAREGSGDGDGEEERYLALRGLLLDVSRSGLALVISAEDHRELKALGREPVLQLLLPLPARAIELEVLPVRFEQLKPGTRVLLGAHIIKMSASDRVLFTEFIDQYESANRSF